MKVKAIGRQEESKYGISGPSLTRLTRLCIYVQKVDGNAHWTRRKSLSLLPAIPLRQPYFKMQYKAGKKAQYPHHIKVYLVFPSNFQTFKEFHRKSIQSLLALIHSPNLMGLTTLIFTASDTMVNCEHIF